MTDWTQPDPDAAIHWRDLGREIGAICTYEDCAKPHRANGYCLNHYLDRRDPNRIQRRALMLVSRERAIHGAVPMDDVEWLLECDPRMTAHQMAPRFDISVGGLRAACKRAGRFDLLDRLVRNAELAGHNVSRAS